MSRRESIESLNEVRRGGELASQDVFKLGTAPQDKEDIGSESVIVAMETGAEIIAPLPFGRTIGNRRKVDLLRRENVEKKYLEEAKVNYQEAVDDDPQDSAVRDETKIKVWEALSQLNQRHLIYIICRHFLAEDFKDTARLADFLLGPVSLKTHGARMWRASRALRCHIDDES